MKQTEINTKTAGAAARRLLPFLLLVLLAVSCTDRDGTEQLDLSQMTCFTDEGFTAEQTRTLMVMDSLPVPGRFRWTVGDLIWAEGDNGWVPARSSDIRGNSDTLANFYFLGTFSAQECHVLYTGNGSTSRDEVTIADRQRQVAPDSSLHLGTSGDCAVAVARKKDGGYGFSLQHKACYLVFEPRLANDTTTLKTPVALKSITVTTTEGDTLCGTYPFGTDGLDTLNVAQPGKSITLECAGGEGAGGGYPLQLDFDVKRNRAYVVIQPGVHHLVLHYRLDVNGADKTVTRTINRRDYAGGTFVRIRHKLSLGSTFFGDSGQADDGGTETTDIASFTYRIENTYFRWDALQWYWNGFDTYPVYSGEEAEYGDFKTIAPTKGSQKQYYYHGTARYSCATMPNANEMYWYVVNGDPYWDNTTVWTLKSKYGSQTYTGGVWLKKRAVIEADQTLTKCSDSSHGGNGPTFCSQHTNHIYNNQNVDLTKLWEDEPFYYFTYAANYIYDGYPAASHLNQVGIPQNTGDYFFLPFMGYYDYFLNNTNTSMRTPYVRMIGLGYHGYYWSSSAGGRECPTYFFADINKIAVRIPARDMRPFYSYPSNKGHVAGRRSDGSLWFQ